MIDNAPPRPPRNSRFSRITFSSSDSKAPAHCPNVPSFTTTQATRISMVQPQGNVMISIETRQTSCCPPNKNLPAARRQIGTFFASVLPVPSYPRPLASVFLPWRLSTEEGPRPFSRTLLARYQPASSPARLDVDAPGFDLLLLCWRPGAVSDIHNHPKAGCWVKARATAALRWF